MIALCQGCPSKTAAADFQNERYGKDMRVQNPTKAGTVRCTLCSRENAPSKAAAAPPR